MPLRLHKPPHDTERAVQLPVFGGKTWDDSVVRALARLQLVWVRGQERETCPSVLQCETAPYRHHSSSKAVVVAVDKRARVPCTVNRTERYRVALRSRGPFLNIHVGFGRVEQSSTAGSVGWRQEFFGRHVRDVWVCDVPSCVCKRQAHGFDEGVEVLRTPSLLQLVQPNSLKDVQSEQSSQPLAVRRDLPYIYPVVIHADGLREGGGVAFQVIFCQF
mmetsp:Transcript_37270/g.73270  ORF Transcript_37270/g.73270 Transcript_37270/m.73270 type:complete len:218 (+) Transcript_37270:557-1210(+)